MRPSPLVPLVVAAVALAALWVARAGDGAPPVTLRSAPAALEPPASTAPAVPPARQSAAFLTAVQTMADVHRLREQTRTAEAAAVPDLRHLALTASDAIVVAEALQALGRLGALAGDAELLALAEDARPKVREQLVVALGHPGSTPAIRLLRRLAIGSDADLRPLAIGSLGRIGGREAEASLRELAQRSDLGETERACVGFALQRATRPGSGRRVERPPQPVVDSLPEPGPAFDPSAPQGMPLSPPGLPTGPR